MPWSAWQVYGDKAWDVDEWTRRTAQLGSGVIDTHTDADVSAYLETLRGTANAFTDGGDPTPFTLLDPAGLVGVQYNVSTIKSRTTTDEQSSATVTLNQASVTYMGSAFDGQTDPFPPLLDTLVEGVDYAEIPGSGGEYVEYESDTTVFVGWLDKTVDLYVYSGGSHTDPDGTVTDLTVPDFNLNLFVAPPPATLDWPSFGPGTNLGPFGLTGLGSENTISPAVVPQSFPFSGISAEDFVLTLQSDFQNATVFPLGDLTMPSAPTDPLDTNQTAEGLVVIVDVGADSFSTQVGFGQLQVVFTLPRFRYWIPETDNVYTVGGHWATAGGGVMQVLINGDWHPIVDGPAP